MGEGCWAVRNAPRLWCSWSVMGNLASSPSSESGRDHGCGPWALGRPALGSAFRVLVSLLSAGYGCVRRGLAEMSCLNFHE